MIGIASFGPLWLDISEVDYGCILKTPKPHWAGFNVKAAVERITGSIVIVDTDVNCVCIGEWAYGEFGAFSDLAYITVGTGIGVGVIVNGKILHGILHSEMGHILPRPMKNDDFGDCCPFHNNCIEGMASGAAIECRTGRNLNLRIVVLQ